MKKFTCFSVSLALVVLLAVGCDTESTDDEVVPVGPGPLDSLAIADAAPVTVLETNPDDPPAVLPDGTLHLKSMFTLGFEATPVGTISDGKISVTLPTTGFTTTALQADGIKIEPTKRLLFAGQGFLLVKDGYILGKVYYGKREAEVNEKGGTDVTETRCGYLYSKDGPVTVSGGGYDIAAESGWNAVTIHDQGRGLGEVYSTTMPLLADSEWMYRAFEPPSLIGAK